MSNETDLDWLARNVHKWRDGANFICLSHNDWQPVFSEHPRYCAKWFTKASWLARRAELQNKPTEWPERANWLAQHEDGEWTFYAGDAGCPPQRRDDGCWHSEHAAMRSRHTGEVLGDWRDTLEKRPEEFQPFTSIEDNQEKAMKQDNGWHERGELPPVGLECIAATDGIPDANCVIIAISTEQVVVKWTENQIFDVLDMPGWSFRPISTEREVAIEEMCQVAGLDGLMFGLVAGKLYDAGYRKESK